MADCGVCAKSLKSVKTKITCNDCKSGFHGKCVNLSIEDISYITSENEVWRCQPCGKVRRKSMVMESATKDVTYEDMLQKFNEIRAEFLRVEKSLGASIESCHSEVKDNIDLSRKGNEEITVLKTTIERLMDENQNLKKKVTFLEGRLDDMEQHSRKNCIEIHGIPEANTRETPAETLDLVRKVGDAVGYTIEESMVDTCHRLKKKAGGGKPAGIIVKMVRRLDAEALLQKKREKKDLSTRHMDLPSDSPVWINESLSPARRLLLFHAREAKVKKGYKYLWIRGGRILLRKNDNDKVQVINHLSDIESL